MFIQIIQGPCSREAEMRDAIERWRTDCEPGADGWLGGTYGFTDDGTFVGVVRFTSEEAARRNSERPEQGRWWSETERLFDGPVEFHDCRDVTVMLEGGSDQAGFVQVIEGKCDDPARMRSLLEQTSESLHAARPEILGATLAIEDDGTFVETVAFTDEATAREHEGEMADEIRSQMEEARTHDVAYLDLHQPWFATHGQATPGR
jgi:hypothetical protein